MDIEHFDYSTPAELYTYDRRKKGRSSVVFRRFDSAAKAIRYSMEELERANLPGSLLEVDESRYQHTDIKELYDSGSYPLKRKAGKEADAEKT